MNETSPKPGPRFRKLRIAWSVGWGIFGLLLIVLWVRSYWRGDWLDHNDRNNTLISIGSSSGALSFTRLESYIPDRYVPKRGWTCYATKAEEPLGQWLYWQYLPGIFIVSTSYLFFVLLVAATSAAPWVRWRFSLSTLLIGMTLVALVLGLIVAFQ
jgi:hypothetical protein